jgi:hypothetical protein
VREIWRCGDVEIRKFGDEKMWRWVTNLQSIENE